MSGNSFPTHAGTASIVTSTVEYLYLPIGVGPQWHSHHYVPATSMLSPQYNFCTVFFFFSKKSQTILISCLKLFSGFFGQTKPQVFIWVCNAFMMWALDVCPTSSALLCIPGNLSSCSYRQSTLPLQGLCTWSSWECPPMPWFSPHHNSLLKSHFLGGSCHDLSCSFYIFSVYKSTCHKVDAHSICDVLMVDVNHVGFDQSSDKRSEKQSKWR